MMAEDLAVGALVLMVVAHAWNLFDKRIRDWMVSGTATIAFGAMAFVQAVSELRWAWIALALGHVARAVVLFRRDGRAASGTTPAEAAQ